MKLFTLFLLSLLNWTLAIPAPDPPPPPTSPNLLQASYELSPSFDRDQCCKIFRQLWGTYVILPPLRSLFFLLLSQTTVNLPLSLVAHAIAMVPVSAIGLVLISQMHLTARPAWAQIAIHQTITGAGAPTTAYLHTPSLSHCHSRPGPPRPGLLLPPL
ncbi:hypothetical protein N431DRAFT_183574 [Stipitochalara longipes BDJ]|nr:hypothetical protein N431DRAFT_183574 [Stipitochalara longipes BDJ]